MQVQCAHTCAGAAGNLPFSSPAFWARLLSLTVFCVLKYLCFSQSGFLKKVFISISDDAKSNL